MFGKRSRLLMVLAAAMGIPYAWFNENLAGSISTKWAAWKKRSSPINSSGSADGTTRYFPISTSATDAGLSSSITGSQPFPRLHALTDVLRFDVSPRWVIDNWERVSAVRAERDLEGLRVALVTGTNLNDVAGSLTYYFDRYQRVRRITLHGHTGDELALVALATKNFALRAEPSLGAGMYVRRWNATPMNAMRISHAPVVRVTSPNTRFLIQLELNDVTAGYGLSTEFRYLLQHDQDIQRWGT